MYVIINTIGEGKTDSDHDGSSQSLLEDSVILRKKKTVLPLALTL